MMFLSLGSEVLETKLSLGSILFEGGAYLLSLDNFPSLSLS